MLQSSSALLRLRRLTAHLNARASALIPLRLLTTHATSAIGDTAAASGTETNTNINNGSVCIGGVELAVAPDGSRRDLVPIGYNRHDVRHIDTIIAGEGDGGGDKGGFSQQRLAHLRWMMQKYALRQDMFLLGAPGPARRRLALQFCELHNLEVRCVFLSILLCYILLLLAFAIKHSCELRNLEVRCVLLSILLSYIFLLLAFVIRHPPFIHPCLLC
jgi:hypothetical protein